ncbi:Hypothetical protein CINCED_3A022788 [Cinara cedri]|uniref:DUF659 domain-containing protein n=1 Tax=Cinara cedri TaxID=506608 RepID=A0A5E4N6J9_9HEMI|nr:Hypothetical protein CINCED_3A022788 [Cinara cedri]
MHYRGINKKKQLLIISQNSNSKNVFFEDVFNAFVAANIPLHKLDNHVLKLFLEKYIGKSISDESTLRNNYIPNIYKSVPDQIISDIGNNYVYIIVDETTDPRGLAIVNLLICKLDGMPSKSYLVACKELKSTNYETICQFINSLLKIFPGIEQNVLFFISDVGTYMIKAAKNIKNIFPEINSYYIKKAFLKAPSRINKYRKEMPGILLPPEPIITRLGICLNVAIFYANNVEEFKNVIESLTDDATSVE